MQHVIDALTGIRVGESIAYRNLTVFPLFSTAKDPAGYITLDEALERKLSEITEINEGGSVPELKFINSGSARVFLLDGEELIGAKQNRIINLSILIPAITTVVIPVSCVEAGRWSHRSRQFSSAPRAHYADGRARKMAQVSARLRATGERRSDQSAVWNNIREKSENFRVASETSAMSDIYDQESPRLETYVGAVPVLEGQSGALFAIDGRIVGLDLFDSPETLKKLFPKLLRSYGLDALERAGSEKPAKETRINGAAADAFLKRVSRAKVEEFPAIGAGTDLRLSGRNMTGAALAVDGHIIHLSAFNTSN